MSRRHEHEREEPDAGAIARASRGIARLPDELRRLCREHFGRRSASGWVEGRQAFARAAGVSPSRVSAWFGEANRHETSLPSAETLARICAVTGASADRLLLGRAFVLDADDLLAAVRTRAARQLRDVPEAAALLDSIVTHDWAVRRLADVAASAARDIAEMRRLDPSAPATRAQKSKRAPKRAGKSKR